MGLLDKLSFWIRGKTYTHEQIILNFDDIIKHTIKITKRETIEWINKKVPKRTGQLRLDLIKWINTHWIFTSIWILLDLQTNVEYATKIEGDAAHSDTWFEHSGQPAVAFYANHIGVIHLDDPEAMSGWYIYIMNYVKERWLINLKIATNYILGV